MRTRRTRARSFSLFVNASAMIVVVLEKEGERECRKKLSSGSLAGDTGLLGFYTAFSKPCLLPLDVVRCSLGSVPPPLLPSGLFHSPIIDSPASSLSFCWSPSWRGSTDDREEPRKLTRKAFINEN